MSSNTTNRATESLSLTVFFIYHFIGWLSL